MEERLLRVARNAGVGEAGRHRIQGAHRVAMEWRAGGPFALPSDQHPAFLHPGRTVLILLGDLEESDPEVIAAGALAESRDAALRVPQGVARGALGTRGFELWSAVPEAGEGISPGELLERLVTVEPPVARIALAEALDHLRHAHLLTRSEERRRAVRLAEEVYGPVAPRVHPVLERRLAWWIRRVGRTLERAAPGGDGDEGGGEVGRE